MGFVSELKRRRVIRSVLGYLAAAIGVAEGADIFGPALGLPPFVIDAVVYALVAFFPVFLALAWRYDISLDGVRRTPPLEEQPPAVPELDEASRRTGDSGLVSDTGPGMDGRAPSDPHPRPRERRLVTVLAAHAPGYARLSEQLDPEDAQRFMDRVANVVQDIAGRLDGHLHRLSGAEIVMVFGAPNAHEDDPLRGIRAALAVGDGVRRVSASLDHAEVPPLDESCAVVTGLVLTAGEDQSAGGLSGDALLLASQIAGTAGPNSILADEATYHSTEGLLSFEPLPPMLLEGRLEPVDVYKMTAPRDLPSTVHGAGGLETALVGRRAEMAVLGEALEVLMAGRAQIVSLRGDAGTGKSRLVEEFRQMASGRVTWLEGHAFPYAQGSPYFPVVDLVSRLLGITDFDSPDVVRKKISEGLTLAGTSSSELEAWVGSLYELEYPELANVQPDAWRPRLHDALFRLLSSVALKRPTVIFLEDLHWADSATVELIEYVAERLRQPVLLLLTYRPGFDSEPGFDSPQGGSTWRELCLENLSSSEARSLVEGLLDSEQLPEGVTDFVLSKAEGNPFYVEEVVNTLVEGGTLRRGQEGWALARNLSEVTVPASVQGHILSRVDRLHPATRRTLQEAAVIGRVVPDDLLSEVCFDAEGLEDRLRDLVELGVLRTKHRRSRSEYLFNHALTQEVVYDSLLKADRKELHERVAEALERLYPDRVLEFCETLAFHYHRAESRMKAMEYLVRAGEKSWRRYALADSHRYYDDAYQLLVRGKGLSRSESALLLDLLNHWAIVYNHLGDYRTLAGLLEKHEDLARSLADSHPGPAAFVLGWLGYALQCREQLGASYRYLAEALDMADRTGHKRTIAYVSAWITRTCVDMGRLDEALEHGRRAEEIAQDLEPDAKLFRFLYSALGLAHYFRGDRRSLDVVSESFLHYGEEHMDLRSILLGHVNRGCSFLVAGEYDLAAAAFEEGVNVSVDPMYSMYARLMLGVTHASAGRLEEAEKTLTEVVDFDREHGFDLLGTTARGMLSIVLLSKGQLAKGVEVAEEVLESYRTLGNRYRHALQEYMLGRVYLRLALREGDGGLGLMARNVGFLLKNLPHARTRAAEHLEASVGLAREIGAKGVLGQALLDLARLRDVCGEVPAARAALKEAEQVLEACQATGYLEEVRRTKAALVA